MSDDQQKQEVVFDPATHTYWWRGERLPSVTQVMQRGGLYAVYDGIPHHILEKARQIGNEVHAQIHLYHLLQAPFEPGEKAVEGCLTAYERFLADSRYELIETEVSGVYPLHRYAGTLDSVGFLNGERALIDIKTTSQIHREAVEVQTAAYAEIWNHGVLSLKKLNSGREPVVNRFVLQLKKNGRYSLIQCDDRTALHKFLSCL